MDIIVDYKFYYPERSTISHIIDKTLKEYAQKCENSPWYIEFKYNTQIMIILKKIQKTFLSCYIKKNSSSRI